MLYFLSAFIIFILFLVLQRDKRASVKYLVSTVLVYILSIFFMILYQSKDVRYYNVIRDYFLLPNAVWKNLMFFPMSKSMIIRFMNLFALLTIYFGCNFSLAYQNKNNSLAISKAHHIIGTLLTAEFILYDPLAEKLLYLFFYPYVMDSAQYNMLLGSVHAISLLVNNVLVAGSILNLLVTNRQMDAFPSLKHLSYGETISYTLIMVSYLILFAQLPNHMTRTSKVAGYTSYNSLSLYQNMTVYKIFPYYLFFSSVLMGISIVTLVILSNRINRNDFIISSQIDAVNTTSKTFCHYMKNELLALQAEIRMLDVSLDSQKDLEHILERCQTLYSRLDIIHHSTRNAKLTMKNTNLEELITKMLERMSNELKDIQVSVSKTGTIPDAMLDANYFEQAVQNIITNAIDAMSQTPLEERTLNFVLRSVDNWISLSITDTGPGISQNDISHIFDPYFSSHPVAEHWGIGLTQTYRIIKAHEGRIVVKSQKGVGTTFCILLPNLKKIMN